MKDNESKILFIHVEVQSYSSNENVFAERMFRYFYRIWDKFRYKYQDSSDIVGSAIYTYKGSAGKDNEIFLAKIELFNELVSYNKVKTIVFI